MVAKGRWRRSTVYGEFQRTLVAAAVAACVAAPTLPSFGLVTRAADRVGVGGVDVPKRVGQHVDAPLAAGYVAPRLYK